MVNTHISSTGKPGFDSLQSDHTPNNVRNKQKCCVVL